MNANMIVQLQKNNAVYERLSRFVEWQYILNKALLEWSNIPRITPTYNVVFTDVDSEESYTELRAWVEDYLKQYNDDKYEMWVGHCMEYPDCAHNEGELDMTLRLQETKKDEKAFN